MYEKLERWLLVVDGVHDLSVRVTSVNDGRPTVCCSVESIQDPYAPEDSTRALPAGLAIWPADVEAKRLFMEDRLGTVVRGELAEAFIINVH